MEAIQSRIVILIALLSACFAFLATDAYALPVDSFGEATVFKSQGDLDQVALAFVTPANDHLFIGGDGIGNGGFTLQTDAGAGVQLGLRAADRFLNDFLPNDGAGTYFATRGASPAGPSDPPGSVRASWNYYMHVDLGANIGALIPSGDVFAPGPLSAQGVVDSVLLDVDFDPAVVGTSFVTVDAYAQAIALAGATAPLLIQDSQNLAFDFWALLGAPPFDVDADGVYTIRLRAMSGATMVATTEIDVVVGLPNERIVSFGTEGGQPTTETFSGGAVESRDAVSLDTTALLVGNLPAGEDLDGLHVLPNGRILFSTTTSVTLNGTVFTPGDIVEWTGPGYNLFFDESLITATVKNIDAFSVLPNGNLLVSTSASASIFGFSFLNGDVVEVDMVGGSAALYMGLDEATLFTGANQDIDALHVDPETGDLLVSVRTAGGGTIGGLAYSDQDADLFALDLSSGVSASVFLDGTGLYDGATRQLDAAYVPEPSMLLQLASGTGLLMTLGRLRRRS